MKTLNQLTQSHLSVLVLDQNSHNPIARMPIYAELSIVEEAPPYTITVNDLGAIAENSDFFGHPTVGSALRASLARYVDEKVLRELEEEKKQEFLRLVIKVLEREAEAGLFSKPESEIQEIVNRAVQKAMEMFGIEQSQAPRKKSLYSYPLGYLATDHVGYASFDLTRISDLTRSFQNNGSAVLEQNKVQTGYAFFLYPMGKEGIRFDALEQGRFTPEAVFAKLSIERPTLAHDLKILNLPSMQKPSLVDWYFSPGSFAAHPEFLVGDDGCERLFPAQIALQEFNLRQVVRIVGDLTDKVKIPADYKFAWVDDYKVTWQSLGHSLGEILYSLPLAPGESVKLAVIDWSWESTTQRTEQTALSEEVLHQTHRDRTISETVKAGLRELQMGSSFMGGVATSAGGSGSTGAIGVAIGNAWSLGGSTATSEGSRELTGENVQRLSDSFSQASSAQRELNSTVVIQARQEEKESIQTRTFTNYNHSHTLTILYYEVLRHFKVVVEWVRRRPAVLKPSALVLLNTDDDINRYRHLLEENLIDKKLNGGFDAIEKLLMMELDYGRNDLNIDEDSTETPFWEGDIVFKAFELGMQSSTALKEVGQSDEKLECYLLTTDGAVIKLRTIQFNDDNVNRSKTLDYKDFYYRVFVKPDIPGGIAWKNIAGIEFTLRNNDELSLGRFSLNGIYDDGLRDSKITYDGGVKQLIKNVEGPFYLPFDGSTHASSEVIRPQPRPQSVVRLKPEKLLSKEEYLLREKLKSHFIEFNAYYSQLIHLSKDTSQIAIDFESADWKIPGQINKLIDHAEPYPLETFGSYIAYPLILTNTELSAISAEIENKDLRKYAEKLITLPTRGVFAEGKLGHCNISEEIDNTRFWKWEEHPIPFEAPGINPVTPITPQPQQTNVTPTAFPSSLVNIVNPSAAPDPTGLAAALKVLGTPNIFRDMSGQQEVADLLKKLSDNTISIAEAANKANEIQKKYGSIGGNGSSSSTGSSRPNNSSEASRSRPDQPSNATQDMLDMQNVLGRGVKSGLTTPEAAQDIYESAARERFTPETFFQKISTKSGDSNSSSNQSPIDVRLRLFIPSRAVGINGLNGFDGDNRDFSYDDGTSRAELWIDALLSTSTNSPVRIKRRAFGQSAMYRATDLIDVAGKPFWWKAVKKDPFLQLEAQPIGIKTQAVTDDTLRVKGYMELSPIQLVPTLHLNFFVNGVNPLQPGAPAIDCELDVLITRSEGIVSYKVEGKHDGFPAYELYIEKKLVYSYDPVKANASPANLAPVATPVLVNIPWTLLMISQGNMV
jgi:hypothetical protein